MKRFYSSSGCRSGCDKDCFHHFTLAPRLSLCCESHVHESVFMSLSFKFLLMVSLNPETRVVSLSVTRRQLKVANLLW